MSKVIFFCVPAHGHVNPQLALVNALVKKGEEVIYYCAPGFREKIEKTGAEFRPLVTSADHIVENMGLKLGRNAVRVAAMAMDVSLEVTDKLAAEVKKENPDYIVADILAYFGMAVAEVNNIPLITFVPVFCSDLQMIGSIPAAFVLRILWHVITAPAEVFRFLSGAKKFKKYFKDNYIDFFNPYSRYSELNIVTISRYFQYEEKQFPDDKFCFTGPLLFYDREKADFPVEKLAGKKVIYVSLGTVYNNRPQFFENCIKAFENTEYTVIMSCSGLSRALPANFIVRDYVPQLQVLPYVSVFITHGGMNSIIEGLYFGVPLVIVPQAMDQYINGHRAAELHVGICLNNEMPSPAKLRSAVEKVLAGKYRAYAIIAGETLKAAGGLDAALAAISRFKGRNTDTIT